MPRRASAFPGPDKPLRPAKPWINGVTPHAVGRADQVFGASFGIILSQFLEQPLIRARDRHARRTSLPHPHQPDGGDTDRGDLIPSSVRNIGQRNRTPQCPAPFVQPHPRVNLVNQYHSNAGCFYRALRRKSLRQFVECCGSLQSSSVNGDFSGSPYPEGIRITEAQGCARALHWVVVQNANPEKGVEVAFVCREPAGQESCSSQKDPKNRPQYSRPCRASLNTRPGGLLFIPNAAAGMRFQREVY